MALTSSSKYALAHGALENQEAVVESNFPAPPQSSTSGPARATRISEPRQSALSFFPLYTTNAEMMMASTTGAALAFGRAMLLCLGLTSPLI
jgi:hypothetical protein